MSDSKKYAVKENKELEPIQDISFGNTLPSNDEGVEGHIFLLIIDEQEENKWLILVVHQTGNQCLILIVKCGLNGIQVGQ